ncbi:unnamed protein product [Nippostrongylus brasiliensis]|uniref:Dus domain-containing protein n=1 Tax=Nippostrongylus brasiliensis TaxID=27835 RepID=A0A0N4XQM7_NIPBR|nr:unnamed protein product [Nippostrongylus brasiliensis]
MKILILLISSLGDLHASYKTVCTPSAFGIELHIACGIGEDGRFHHLPGLAAMWMREQRIIKLSAAANRLSKPCKTPPNGVVPENVSCIGLPSLEDAVLFREAVDTIIQSGFKRILSYEEMHRESLCK